MNDKLDNANFVLYCAQHYDNPQCSGTDEFLEDLKRVKYIKKLITRYVKSGDLKERLILNHLIILKNVFGAYHLPRILYLKMGDQMKYVKPFLILLEVMPDEIRNVGKEPIVYTDEIALDQGIIEALRKL